MLLLISIMKVQPQLGLKEITKGGGLALLASLCKLLSHVTFGCIQFNTTWFVDSNIYSNT